LLFQTLDDKDNCVGIYTNGELHFDYVPDGLTHTWSWTPYLDAGVEYAKIWVGGKTLTEVCPDHIKEDWDEVNEKLFALYRSFGEAKVDLRRHCFYDMVPTKFLKRHAATKDRICRWVFENHEKPDNHDLLVQAHGLVHSMEDYTLNIDRQEVLKQRHKKAYKGFWKLYNKYQHNVKYLLYGSATGRLTTTKTSFPILRLNKEYRQFIKPNQDWFLELDINAADLRSLFLILGKNQPSIDIHDWNIQNIFGEGTTRDMAKKLMFSWLYDLDKRNDKLEAAYGRDKILRDHWKDGWVTNPFGRKIQVERENAISYLIQSTTADYVMTKLIEIDNLLEGKNTRLAFTIHDSIVLDLDWEERYTIKEVLECMRADGFVVSCKTGKDFGNLKDLAL